MKFLTFGAQEVNKIRQERAAKFNFNLSPIVRDYQKQQPKNKKPAAILSRSTPYPTKSR
jgi:hypothetical protein